LQALIVYIGTHSNITWILQHLPTLLYTASEEIVRNHSGMYPCPQRSHAL